MADKWKFHLGEIIHLGGRRYVVVAMEVGRRFVDRCGRLVWSEPSWYELGEPGTVGLEPFKVYREYCEWQYESTGERAEEGDQ